MKWMIGGLAAYGAVVGGLYLMQDNLIFPRAAAANPKYTLPQNAEKLNLQSADGHDLTGHLVRPLGASRGLLIGFSGNAWNGQDCLTFIANRVKDWDIAVFHYRGYSPSGGNPSQAALFADALMIHDYLTEALKPEKTIGVGFSLGSGVVAYLAAERPLAGQLLFTPFDSILDIAKQRYRFAPVKWLLKHPFDSRSHQRRTRVPAAVVLASDDRVVPQASSERLIEELAEVVMLETIPNSSHGGIYDLDEVDAILREAIDALDRVRSD